MKKALIGLGCLITAAGGYQLGATHSGFYLCVAMAGTSLIFFCIEEY